MNRLYKVFDAFRRVTRSYQVMKSFKFEKTERSETNMVSQVFYALRKSA